MEKNETNKKWGGKRAGAGRKKTTAKRIGINVPEDVAEILSTQNNLTEFICEAIRYYSKSKKSKS